MTNFLLDFTHSSNGDGDGWGDGTGAGNAFNSIPNAVSGGVGTGDVLFVRGVGTIIASETWTGPTANMGKPPIVLGVKSGTTAVPPLTADLVDGMWEGSTDPTWVAQTLPGVTSDTFARDVTIQGSWFFYAVALTPLGQLLCGGDSTAGKQTYVECQLSSGTGSSNQPFSIGSSGAEREQKQSFINCEIFSTRSTWRIVLQRSGVHEFIGGRLTSTVAPTGGVFAPDTGDMHLECRGFDMSSIGANEIFAVSSQLRAFSAKFINCSKGASGSLIAGTDDSSPWRVESYNTDSNPSSFDSADAILDLEIQDHRGQIVEDEADFRKAGANDGASGGEYSLAFLAIAANVEQPYVGLEGPWNSLRVGSGLETTMTVHIANDSASDLNDDDVRIEVLQPNGDGSTGANEYKLKAGALLTSTVMTNGTDGDWTFVSGGNAQEIAVTLDPAYQGNIMWRAVTYVAVTIYVDPLPVLS